MFLNDVLVWVIYAVIIVAILYVGYSFIPDEVKQFIGAKLKKDEVEEDE